MTAKHRGRAPVAPEGSWGESLRIRREALGMTQKQFAVALALPVRSLEGWESCRNSPPAYRALIDRAIDQLVK